MVTKHSLAIIMHLIRDLTYIFERARSASEMTPNQAVPVKGDVYILATMRRAREIVVWMNKSFDKFSNIIISMDSWITYLEQNYSDKAGLFEKVNITYNDAKQLTIASEEWISGIIQVHNQPDTVLIQETAFEKIYEELAKEMDEDRSKDLKDGIGVLRHDFATPAVMILFRIAESVIQKFYKKITGNEPENKSWGQMLTELDKRTDVDKTLMGYLHFLNQKRIDAAHPYRRYTQEEGERILLTLKDLVQEISAHK